MEILHYRRIQQAHIPPRSTMRIAPIISPIGIGVQIPGPTGHSPERPSRTSQ